MELLSRIRRWVRANPFSVFLIFSIAVHLVLICIFSGREASPRDEKCLIRFDFSQPPVEEFPEELVAEIPSAPPIAPTHEEVIPFTHPPLLVADPVPAAAITLSGAVATAAPQQKIPRRDLPSYIAFLQAIIDQEIDYPPLASRQRREGEVTVVFILHRSGQLRRLAVDPGGGSSFEPFNREALRAVRRAAKRFPQFPESLSGEELTFRLPIIFSLR